MTTGDPARPRGRRGGADVGATLVKLAMRDARGRTTTATLPAEALDVVAQRLRDLAPTRARAHRWRRAAPRRAARAATA